ncbi:hypothetical protein [Mucilaginibacter antarcticus]|uniref:hypothetical protein n=1 Tax=Mucilaginibacter antarcticus TaxID=1855725 RepID=UPI00362B11EA
MAKKVVLVTSTQPSLNPRLVKEADTLCNAGYEVTVLYSYWNNWGADFSDQLLKTKPWKAICVGGNPETQGGLYFLSRLINKIAKAWVNSSTFNFLTDIAISRASYCLKRETKNHPADLYIGHNPGALPAIIAAAKANNKPCGFDAEDFHRNETSDDSTNLDVRLKTQLEDKYLSHLDYFTTSSPEIAMAYQQLYPALNPVVLLNVFPVSNDVNTNRIGIATGPLKLFWFSQTIGDRRGLQDVVAALKSLDKDSFELHILGSQLHSDPDFIKALLTSGVNLTIHQPIPPTTS